MHQVNLINLKPFNKEFNSIIFLIVFAIIYGGYLSYFPNESISFAKTYLNDYNFNKQNEFYLKGILSSPITAQIYIPYFFLKIGINEEILNRLWSALTCFVSIVSLFYFSKTITRNNFYSILISLIFLSHKFINTHYYSIHYPVSFFYFGQMGMYMTLLSISLLFNYKKDASISILIINFFCHASWGIFNLIILLLYFFLKKIHFKINRLHFLIFFVFLFFTTWGHLDYKKNLDNQIQNSLQKIDRFQISEFKEQKGIEFSKNELIDKRAYLKSHNPFFDNTKSIKNFVLEIFKFLFFEILLIVLFFTFKKFFNKDFTTLIKILIFLTFSILIFRFIIFESYLFLNLMASINIKIPMLLDRMIISRYLNLNSLIVLILPLSILFYFASLEKSILLRFFLSLYFSIFSISLLFNSLIISEHLPTIKVEKIIHNFLLYFTFPAACVYFLIQSKVEKFFYQKNIINNTYKISLVIFFVLNLIYFPFAKSITNKKFFSDINSDLKKIASKKNNEIITSSYVHGYIDLMYLSKSPIVVPMFSIRNIDSGRQINIYCEDEINSPFIESNDYFRFIENCFEKRKKEKWLTYNKDLGLNYVVTRNYLNLDLDLISSNNFINIYKIKN